MQHRLLSSWRPYNLKQCDVIQLDSAQSAPSIHSLPCIDACLEPSRSTAVSGQPRKAGPADDAATAAARDFLLGSDVAAQAIIGVQADGGSAAAAGAQLPQVWTTFIRRRRVATGGEVRRS